MKTGALVVLVTSLLWPTSDVRAEEDIVLGMSAAFSGPSRALGIELYRGSQAYLEKVNREGGVHGRNVVIKAYDDGYDPPRAITNTLRLVEEDDVFALFNYVGTPTVTRVLPLLKLYRDQHIFLLFPFTGAQPQRQPPYAEFVFNLRASYADETRGLVDHLVDVGRTRIAVFYQADAYGRSGWEGARNAMAEHGLRIVGEATYRRGSVYAESFDRQVEILRRSNPQAVISVCSYSACAGLIRDARDAGWDVPIANLSFGGTETMIELIETEGSSNVEKTQGIDYLQGILSSQVVPSYEDYSLPAVWEYRKLMDAYGDAMPPDMEITDYQPLRYSFISLEGYLNARLVVEMLKRLGPEPARDELLQAAESREEFDLGTFTPISFGPGRHQGSDTVYFTTLKDGRYVPLTDWQKWEAEAE